MCDQMHCAALPPARTWTFPVSGLSRLLGRRRPRLNLDSLSGHMLRDLGLSTGRESVPRDPLRD